MDAVTADLIKVIAGDIIKIIVPAAIVAYVGYRTVKRQFEIERIRIHEKDKVDAHKRLLKFARELRNRTFPLAEDKRQEFIDLMCDQYFSKLELDCVYFAREATNILDTLEERYICMTRGELIPEMDPDEERRFVNEKLFQLANQLVVYVKNVMRAKEIST